MKRLSRADREAAVMQIRATRHNAAQFPQEYQHLTHLTSSLGKDVKFRAPAEHRNTALGYARKRNLVLGPDEDVDNDQINDVILYDYHGNPVIINGYELKDSERPYRQKYRERYTTNEAKTKIGGYDGFKRQFHTLEGMTEYMERQPPKFARITPPKPKRTHAPSLYDYFSDKVRAKLFEAIDGLLEGRTHLKSTFSIFNVISICYIQYVLGVLWCNPENKDAVDHIKAKVPDNGDLLYATRRMELFKGYLKKNQEKINGLIETLKANMIGASVDTSSEQSLLRTILDPVLKKLGEIPPDVDFAQMKALRDTAAVHQVNLIKAALTDEMKAWLQFVKSRIINFYFASLDEGDLPNDSMSPTYANRVRRYLDMLLTLDPMSRSKHIYALLRDSKHTSDMMTLMDKLRDDRYLPLYQEINAKLQTHGWLA